MHKEITCECWNARAHVSWCDNCSLLNTDVSVWSCFTFVITLHTTALSVDLSLLNKTLLLIHDYSRLLITLVTHGNLFKWRRGQIVHIISTFKRLFICKTKFGIKPVVYHNHKTGLFTCIQVACQLCLYIHLIGVM